MSEPIRVVNRIQVEALQTLGFSGLDPITIILKDYGDSRGKLIIECYGKAWATYWGAMGKETLREFIGSCDAEYIANSMMSNSGTRITKGQTDYLLRIVKAVQQAVKIDEQNK